jgi:hypothetical protein
MVAELPGCGCARVDLPLGDGGALAGRGLIAQPPWPPAAAWCC